MGRSGLTRLRGDPVSRDMTVAAREIANLLVVSDLHLGGALRPPLDFGARRRVVALDRELCRFLEYHAANPRDGRPWTLVFNGDTIDFMPMNLQPEKGSSSAVPGRRRARSAVEDDLYGLAFD